MSSPTMGVFSMSHLGPQGGSGGSKINLAVGGRRGSGSGGMFFNNRRGSITSDKGVTSSENGDGASSRRRGSGGSEDGERGRSGGTVHFADDKNSVFTSTSYAASRGLQRTSPSTPTSATEVSQPVAPPRAKGPVNTLSSFFSPASRTQGIMKSSSEICIPAPVPKPMKGILKSSSGILKINDAGIPLSKSSSGGTISTGNRVNFSDVICKMNDESGPVSPAAPPSPLSSSTSVSKVSVTQLSPTQKGSSTIAGATATPSRPDSLHIPQSITVALSAPVTAGSPSSLQGNPPSPPPVAPPRTRSQTSNSAASCPTSRPLARQLDDKVIQIQQQTTQKRKLDSPSHAVPYQQIQYPQQRDSEQKATSHPQAKEVPLQLQQKESQRSEHKESDKTLYLQQQVKLLQQKGERNDIRAASHGKFQQPKEADSQAILKLKQQNQQQLQLKQQQEAEKQELLKKQKQQRLHQQKSPNIEIIEVKSRREEYVKDQQFQQPIRAGSLGSGESAAILQQRSRSPLLPLKRASGVFEKQVITPIIVDVNSNTSSEKVCIFKSQEFIVTETSNTECSKPASKISNHVPVRGNTEPEIISKSDSSNGSTTVTGVVAVEKRSGVIRAAAKAYTQNFQSYSYSSYLTKTRKDSVPSKEASLTAKEAQENSLETKLPINSKDNTNTSCPPHSPTPVATSPNSSVQPNAKGPVEKIIVPIQPPISSNESIGTLVSDNSNISRTGREKLISIKEPTKVYQSKDTSGNSSQKTANTKSSNNTVKSQANTQDLKNHNIATNSSVSQKISVKTTREKSINSSSNIEGQTPPTVKSAHRNTQAPPHKRETKALPPILSNLKATLADKMKGSSEGALLVACRVAEEDQILRLVKELTATGTLDAAALNQIDRTGRTSLSYCCANAYLRIVESLTSMPGLDINKPDTDGNTPLHYASQAGHTEIVSHLVNKCNRTVDLDARNALGFTPLMKAAIQGRTKIAKILLFAGASPHLRDFGRGLCAVEWARYTGRHICSELIDSVQKSCSSHIRERWTSDPDLKSHSSTSLNTLGQGDNKDSWIKHKIKKAFHKSESKKEFSVVTNLSTMAVCATSPLLPTAVTQQDLKPQLVVVPQVQITEVKVPDCYEDPEDALSQLPPPPPPPILVTEEPPPKSPKKQSKNSSTSATSSSSSSSVVASQDSASTSSTTPSSPASGTSTSAVASSSSSSSSTAVASTTPVYSSSSAMEDTQSVGAEGGAGDPKSNGSAKSVVSSSKLPFSNNKKRK
ncbi:platelet binding protein GspB-like isoform X2 [Palaemon carinicauda]|uniref:platelet binding protein GspB-like isoform X2 n=1 Tax=Palaemon carinicauda TaxID=392227 RepID=UPI0035B5BFF3